MSVKPITPSEAKSKKISLIPEIVIECFNELISRKLDIYGSATILQKDVVNLIESRSDLTASQIYSNKYLDVEDYYRKAGWKVVYDKPAYCENYDAFFVFKSE